MELSLQTIYFIVGVAGLVLAAVFAIAAVAYFFRADIRAVRADLSGKTRQEGLASAGTTRRRTRGEKGALVREDEWQGEISHGRLDEASGSDALTDEDSSTGASSTGSMDDAQDATVQNRRTGAGGVSAGVAASSAANVMNAAQAANMQPQMQTASTQSVAPTFTIVRSLAFVHSPFVIGESGEEVPLVSGAQAPAEQSTERRA